MSVAKSYVCPTLSNIAVLALVASLAGCSANSLPPGQVSEVNAEIQSAKILGAVNNPQAALHLKLATDQLAEARRLANNGDEDKANLTLARAKVDAQLALVLSKEAAARHDANQALQKLQQTSSTAQGANP